MGSCSTSRNPSNRGQQALQKTAEERKEDPMDLEDLFKGKHRKHGHHHDDHAYGHQDQHSYGGHHHGHNKLETMRSLFGSLPHKKALLTGLLILGIFLLVIGVSLIWALVPIITNLAGYVETNGIQGVLNTLLSLAQLFWKGNG